MTNENQGNEYIKVLASILTKELSLTPASSEVEDNRVFIYNQDFKFPKFDDLFIVLSESPGRVMSNVNSINEGSTTDELQEMIIQREINIDIISKNSEARQRKEEVVLALRSVYSQQQQEANGFMIAANPSSFIDISEVEGSARVNRYRCSVFMHCRYSKQKTIDYYDNFPYNINTN